MSFLPRLSFRRPEPDARNSNRRHRGPYHNFNAPPRQHVAAPGGSSAPPIPQGPFPPLRALPPGPGPSAAVAADLDGSRVCFGGGVAIFHLASGRVVVCFHPRHRYWFLPKGRKDAGEDSGDGAVREGFEESGYRNRLLPLPVRHRQPPSTAVQQLPAEAQLAPQQLFSTEPVYVQLMPFSRHAQYVLSWRVAETVPPDVEAAMAEPELTSAAPAPGPSVPVLYQAPPPYPAGLTLRDRIALDTTADGRPYVPPRHEGTGVDEDERQYESYLLPLEEAMGRLAGTGQETVVQLGWEAICRRDQMEFRPR